MNRFEHVSSDDHHMPLAEGVGLSRGQAFPKGGGYVHGGQVCSEGAVMFQGRYLQMLGWVCPEGEGTLTI